MNKETVSAFHYEHGSYYCDKVRGFRVADPENFAFVTIGGDVMVTGRISEACLLAATRCARMRKGDGNVVNIERLPEPIYAFELADWLSVREAV